MKPTGHVDLSAIEAEAGTLADRADHGLLQRDPLTALLVDVASLRTQLTAAVADLAALRTTLGAVRTDVANQKGILDLVPAVVPVALTSSAPAALTAVNPAAATASTILEIDNGSTAGRLRTSGDIEYAIAGRRYRKAAANNLWNLSAEVDTIAAQYRAYALYVDAAGTASFGAGANAASAALAIAALPAVPSTKAVIGAFIAGPLTDFDAGGGLSAQGTLGDGWPVGV